jgi:hypothetical protein
MGIGILGCDAIRHELEMVTGDDPEVVYREYLEVGLHLHPTELKRVILEKMRALPAEVDVLFLGYGHCQALKGLPDQVKMPMVMLDHEDCIAVLMTPERYHHEKGNGGITWFYPAGWAESGLNGIVQLFKLDCLRDEGYQPEYFLGMMFDGFSRCLFIDTGIDGADACRANSERLAETIGLRHETVRGTLDLIREAWRKAKAMAGEIARQKEMGGETH